ncbi:MAG: DNA-processing protein DprA [Candidatus Omnitrophota bacterium]
MDTVRALVGLNMVLDIGSIRLNKLLSYFGKPENIFKASPDELTRVSGIGEGIASKIHSFRQEDIDREISLAKGLGLDILTLESPDYPLNLKYMPDPAIVLYVKGGLRAEDNLSVAVVGSRQASFYGLSCAERFAGDLVECGLTVVSGMARGIDTCAHRGALRKRGRTIAVLGSGFRHIYPPENKELSGVISENGAVISEFPIETGPLKQNFPRRNRLISGLSLGVLVVEASLNSGALITADFALEQGREVFALPGKVDCLNSLGTNALIKQGAKLVSCVEDIVEELNIPLAPKNEPVLPKKDNPVHNLNERENTIYNLLSSSPLLLDEIIEKTGAGVADISETIVRLQVRRLIHKLPSGQFMKR